MFAGPCGSLATQPVLSVAGQQSARAAFGLRTQEWMVREETSRSRSMWPVFINPHSRLPSLPNHNPAILGRQEVIYYLSWLSQHHRPTVWGELTHTRIYWFPHCGLNSLSEPTPFKKKPCWRKQDNQHIFIGFCQKAGKSTRVLYLFNHQEDIVVYSMQKANSSWGQCEGWWQALKMTLGSWAKHTSYWVARGKTLNY